MTPHQERVVNLLKSAVPKETLVKWVKGLIPVNYKRLSIPMNEAVMLAAEGAAYCMANFGETLFFTQSLIIGAALSEKYNHLIIVTTSQYGKSWTMGMLAILLSACRNEKVNICAASDDDTQMIMKHVIRHLKNADDDIKKKLVNAKDVFERMEVSKSKDSLGFIGGGAITTRSMGESYGEGTNKGNKMIGEEGHVILDEASMISETRFGELGRVDFSRKDGKKNKIIEISNPHNPGRFYDELTRDDLNDDELVIWMDVRTAYEEDNVISIEQVKKSIFFRTKSQCIRYLLCELEDYSDTTMFTTPIVDDTLEPDSYCYYYAGLDCGYKGKDDIRLTLGYFTGENYVKFDQTINLKTNHWVDGETGEEIIDKIARAIRLFKIQAMCIDTTGGYGQFYLERLVRLNTGCRIIGINFAQRPTPERMGRPYKHYSALNAVNKRAEMYLDLQNMMEEGHILYSSEISDLVKPELSATTYMRKSSGKIIICTKDEVKQKIGHSPDTTDTCILCLHACILDNFTGHIMLSDGYVNDEDEEDYNHNARVVS